MPIRTCPVTVYYHNLAGGDYRDIKNFKNFTATFPADGTGTPLNYWLKYADFGGSNNEDKASGHAAKDSFLVFDDWKVDQTSID